MWTDSRLIDSSCSEREDSTVITDDKILAANAVAFNIQWKKATDTQLQV